MTTESNRPQSLDYSQYVRGSFANKARTADTMTLWNVASTTLAERNEARLDRDGWDRR